MGKHDAAVSILRLSLFDERKAERKLLEYADGPASHRVGGLSREAARVAAKARAATAEALEQSIALLEASAAP